MRERIIKEIVSMYKDCDGFDEIKRAVRLSMSLTSGVCDWTDEDAMYIIDEVFYRLDK